MPELTTEPFLSSFFFFLFLCSFLGRVGEYSQASVCSLGDLLFRRIRHSDEMPTKGVHCIHAARCASFLFFLLAGVHIGRHCDLEIAACC